jgi:hypothetical protein
MQIPQLLKIVVVIYSGIFCSCLSLFGDVAISNEEAKKIATDAYIWGYPLVVMQRTKQAMTQKTPFNEFLRFDNLATPQFKEIVTPNADTLYASAWLSLKGQPVILQVPKTGSRYYSVEFLDAYTNVFAYVGKRATGTKAGKYLIVGPSWQGKIPSGLRLIKAPTNSTWLIVRVLVSNQQDLKKARKILQQIRLKSSKGLFVPVFSQLPSGTPQNVAQAGIEFFDEMGQALKDNLPPAAQNELLARFARIGIGVDRNPSQEIQNPQLRAILERAITEGEEILEQKIKTGFGLSDHGWFYNLNLGDYGTNYILRAVVAKQGLGANIPAEALYAITFTDDKGFPLRGTQSYIIHFTKDQLPPVNAFWSLTIYDAQTKFLVPNVIDRYAIGDRSRQLMYNADGSVDIYIQHDVPHAKKSNWLPAPGGAFYLVLRLYMPQQEVLNNHYQYPSIHSII